MTLKKKNTKAYMPIVIGTVFLIGAIVLIVHFISSLSNKTQKKERKIQTVTLAPPPPPPPPPPKVEKPPEPEPEEKIEEQQEPEPEKLPDVPDEAPPRDLGLDAEGSAGSDGFGLAARKGGTGLFGGGGNPFAWYGNLVKSELVALLSENEDLRRKGYTAIVQFWVDSDGTIQRFELARGSNDKEIDDRLIKVISKFQKINGSPPPGMGQPIKLKITSNL